MNRKFVLSGIGLVIFAYMIITLNSMDNELDHVNKVNEDLLIVRSNLTESNENITLENEKLSLKVKKLTGEIEELKSELERVKHSQKSSNSSRGNNTRSNLESIVGGTESGKTLLGTFEATAYDDSVESQGQWVGQTASGMKPQVGVIAVDPKVIPLGTNLYVEGYGNCIAGDTGGAIKGNRIDVFKNTASEVRDWGRRQVKVYRR